MESRDVAKRRLDLDMDVPQENAEKVRGMAARRLSMKRAF
jgi:hypothetical protein